MKRMLFNATQAEELRVAIVDGQKLVDLDIESANKEQRKGNIYKAVVTRVEPSLEACFVNYGAERHGFLPFKEIARASLPAGDKAESGRTRIQDLLKEGQELVVQVEKDERGNKGAALTNQISLAGRYLVLMPNNPRGGGVSRRIEGEERNELRDALAQLEVPAGMSLIGRTAGIGRSVEELQWDLNYLLQLWSAIDGAAKAQSGAFLIYQESSLVIRAIRDYFTPDIGELLIDEPNVCEQARQFMAHVMPANANRVKLYTDPVPLFSRFQIEHQIESAYSRTVTLPSGGAIVIDHTEALVAIDVNSAQATKGGDIEQTALNTNLEAADEVARQLRLRDLGGLIVIDFIDMENQKNQREVEERLREALHHDRARVQTGKISRFGLLELSRQRLQPSLGETSYVTCPRCAGTGHVRSTESFALHLLRMLQEEAMKDNTGAVHLQVPVDVATFLLNEKRHDILAIEARHRVEIVLIPNVHFETPRYTLARFRHDQLNQIDQSAPSYKMVEKPAEEEAKAHNGGAAKAERAQPVVQGITPTQPAPTQASVAPAAAAASPKAGLFGRIVGWLRGISQPAEEAKPEAPPAPVPARRERERDSRRGRGDREPRGEREGRGERSERGEPRNGEQRRPRTERPSRAEGAERGPRGERTDTREPREGREAREGRDNKAPRTERPQRERPQETPKPAMTESVEAVTPIAPETTVEPGGEDRESRRRRRGGRGRRADGRTDVASVTDQTVSELMTEAAAPQMPTAATESDTDAMPPVPAEQTGVSPVIAESTAPVVPPTPQPAQGRDAVAGPPPLSAPDLAAAGLQLVETVTASVEPDQTAQPAAVEEPQGQRGSRRRRGVKTQDRDATQEPLVLVETRSETTGADEPTESLVPSEWGPPSNPRRRARPKVAATNDVEPLVLVETRTSDEKATG